MTGPLLETKLHVPRRRRTSVARTRLGVQLNAGFDAAVTLVSAPAGFGKSTLLAEWLDGAAEATAWVSLDERDNDPARFWTYVTTALGSPAALDLVAAPHLDVDALLATLVNGLARIDHESVLVLDDYHVIAAPEIHDAMAFLVEHLPPQVHLVIATRSDPPLPLGRLRARGDLVEIRAADLRFTPDEAAAYLNGTMGLDLSDADVAALEERTEGWAAALQLAALSMHGRQDVSSFIAGFAGDDRYVVDYLAGEVLSRQSDDVRRFLLETAILGRLTGPLCDAVTGGDDGRAMLEELERANLFLVPLDDRRQWYRYHHLFGDVLQTRLRDEHPGADHIDALHRRAADWHDAQGDRPEAIRHALAGHDAERAATLVELAAPDLHQARQEATLRAWLEALPDEVFANRPVLTVDLIGVRLRHGETEGVEALMEQAERWLDEPAGAAGAAEEEAGSRRTPRNDDRIPTASASSSAAWAEPRAMVVVNEGEFRHLPAQIAIFRAGMALLQGDVATTKAQAERALTLIDDDDRLRQGSAAALLGLVHWNLGELDQAGRRYAQGVDHLLAAGSVSDSMGCSQALADIYLAQGRLRDAQVTLKRALTVADDGGGRRGGGGQPVLRGAADMHVGLSVIRRERNDLAGARRHLATSLELGEHAGLPQNPYRSRVAEARLRETDGDLDGALDLLDEAERRYFGDFSPDVRPVAAVRARLRIVRGELREAQQWADERALSPEDDLTYAREFEHLTLARLLLAQQSPAAEPFLDRLLAAAEAGQRTGNVIEALILQALAHQGRGDIRAALDPLDRALVLAEPEGYARVFLDEGAPMISLLDAAAKHGAAADQAGRLLASDRLPTEQDAAPAPPPAGTLVDPLSERELDVLRLLRSELSGPDIARELVVSLNTVRTHTKSIYTKLGVNSRQAAVRRATELGL